MHNLFHSFSTLGLVFLTFFSGGQHQVNLHNNVPVVHEIKEYYENSQTITAQGSVGKFGQTISFSFTFPESGGQVQGTVSGACTGTIQGTYSEEDLQGAGNASCPILLTTITGTATFSAHIKKNEKSGILNTKVAAQGMSEDLQIPVTLSE